MASTVNMNDKRYAVATFVADVVENRLNNLHETVISHWNEVAGEVFDKTYSDQCRAMVDSFLAADGPIRRVALQLSWHGDDTVSAKKFKTVEGVKDPGFFQPKFGYFGDETDIRTHVIRKLAGMWDELMKVDNFTFKLPFPFVQIVISDDEDKTSACDWSEDDGQEDYLHVDLDAYIPTDCTTQKMLNQTDTNITNDAFRLADETFNTIRTCRTVESIVKVVPHLEPYLCTGPDIDKTKEIDDLLKQAMGE